MSARNPGKPQHDFGEDDICVRCGAALSDAMQAPIGCEAGPEGNPAGYLGLALTPEEQARGVTFAEKAEALARRLREGP